jgi:hypothetical protein
MEKPMHRLSLAATRVFTVLLAAATLACAPVTTAQDYTPTVGQEGKDVIWVPTPQSLVDKMLDMAKLTSRDIHYDLGSGDGRTVITAAKRGAAEAYGVEFNPDMVKLSERTAAKEGVAGKAKFINGDIFQTDFSRATVVTLYLLPSLNVKLRPTILKMKPGTRVVSHAFSMEDWQADETATVEGRTAYLWIVPAQVNGRWQMPGGGELTLKQSYQMISGTLKQGQKESAVKGQLSGERISFALDADGGRREFSGQVSGNAMQGTVKDPAGEGKWSATRAAK